MSSPGTVRWVQVIGGIGLILVGGVWILQGAGLLEGSFMTGSSRWLVIGVVCVAAGVALSVRGRRRRG